MATINTDMANLETILRELKEAVVVCDQNARILLYNAAAKRLFQKNEALGLGQSLYEICERAPIEHTLRMLKHRVTDKKHYLLDETNARFVCAAVNDARLFNCHLNQSTLASNQKSVFVFTFEDITSQITAIGKQGYLLETMIKQLRAPLTNLNAAAENLKNNPKMIPDIRKEFEKVIFKESAELTQRFESIVQESSKITNMQWPLSDVHSADLIGCISHRFNKIDGVTVTMTGVPLWLQADSHSLMLVLDCLVRFVQKTCNVSEIDIEALLGDRRVYIDIVWKGIPIPQTAINSILTFPLPDTITDMTVADVLKRHDSEIWSQNHQREGFALLRIPVPDSSKQWEVAIEFIPERPEFYDFSLVDRTKELGDMANRPLSSLNYVVFDTETTGFRPHRGDEILAIAAVRIVNGRILSSEKFERLIKPQHPIPESSVPFLNITEDMVKDEHPVQVVLPQFKAFVNDAVLVAHNGTFDMNFFQIMEDKSGVKFKNQILDTLLLSIIVEENRTDHTLKNLGKGLNVEILGNHSTMGDCLVTAQIFIKLLKLLEAQGITTLSEVISASKRVVKQNRKNA